MTISCVALTTRVYSITYKNPMESLISLPSDPPSRLEISGYDQRTHIVAGHILKLSCTAISGNPPATITWYKNDVQVRKKVIDRLVFFYLRTLHARSYVKKKNNVILVWNRVIASYVCELIFAPREVDINSLNFFLISLSVENGDEAQKNFSHTFAFSITNRWHTLIHGD